MVRILLTSMMLLGVLASSGPASRAQTPPQEVGVAMLAPSALLWVHLVAEKQGYYTQAGVTVRELRVADSPALLQAVSSGSVAAGLSLGDLVIRAIDRGAPIVVAGRGVGQGYPTALRACLYHHPGRPERQARDGWCGTRRYGRFAALHGQTRRWRGG